MTIFLRKLFRLVQGGGAISAPSPPTPPPPPAPGPYALRIQNQTLVSQSTGVEFFGTGYNGGGNWGSFEPSHDAVDFGPTAGGGYGNNVSRHVFRWGGLYGGSTTDAFVNDATIGYTNPENLRIFLNELRAQYNAGVMVIPTFDSNAGQSSLQQSSSTIGDPGYHDCFNYIMALIPFDPLYPAESFSYDTGGRNFWTDPSFRAKFFVMKQYVVQAIIDAGLLPAVFAWEPLPEPLDGFTDAFIATNSLPQFYREATANIYAKDTQSRPVIVGGRGYQTNKIADVYDPAYTTWIYTVDLFVSGVDQANTPNTASWLSTAANFLAYINSHTYSNGQNLCGFVQQVGCKTGRDTTDHSALQTIVNWLTANHMGATQWQFRQNGDSAAGNGFTEYGLIVKQHGTNTDILKTAEIALWASYWAGGTTGSPFKVGLPPTLALA